MALRIVVPVTVSFVGAGVITVFVHELALHLS